MNQRFALAGFMETRVPVDLRSMLSDREAERDAFGHRRYGFIMKKNARVPFAVCTMKGASDDPATDAAVCAASPSRQVWGRGGVLLPTGRGVWVTRWVGLREDRL